MKRVISIGGVAAVGVALLLSSPAHAQVAGRTPTTTSAAVSTTIHVPSDFDPLLSDTRSTGSFDVEGTSLHIVTTGYTSTDKVAEYVDTNTPLSVVGEPSLSYTPTAGGTPGYQLVVDFNNDGAPDGTLVGEPGVYGTDWWATNGSAQFVKDGAASHDAGSGSANHGTLDQWRAAFPNATVKAFGFSLGSGVYGDGLINSITFNGTTYTFAADVVLANKDQCKNGGWAASTKPVFKNQGACVSSFAASK